MNVSSEGRELRVRATPRQEIRMADRLKTETHARTSREKGVWIGAIATVLAALIGAGATITVARRNVTEARSDEKAASKEVTRLRNLLSQRDIEIAALNKKIQD